jgi:hypothetical protein
MARDFAVDWMRKDLGLVLDEARANGRRCGSDKGPSAFGRLGIGKLGQAF